MRPGASTYELVQQIGAGLSAFKDRPMLIIWGERDWCFTTDFLAEWQSGFPQAEVRRCPKPAITSSKTRTSRSFPGCASSSPNIRSYDCRVIARSNATKQSKSRLLRLRLAMTEGSLRCG